MHAWELCSRSRVAVFYEWQWMRLGRRARACLLLLLQLFAVRAPCPPPGCEQEAGDALPAGACLRGRVVALARRWLAAVLFKY